MHTQNTQNQNQTATVENLKFPPPPDSALGTSSPASEPDNFKLETLNFKRNGVPRRRNGKVARLPHAVRRLVNTMLDDGFTYNAIVAKLEQLGYPGFLQQNISRWTKGGYQTWLKEQRFQAVLALVDTGNGRTEASTPIAVDSGK